MSLQEFDITYSTGIEIDRAVENLRTTLSRIDWISNAYGVAVSKLDATTKRRNPFVYEGGATKNYVSAKPDDSKKGTLFFMVGDRQNGGDEGILKYHVGIIFSVNLAMIDPIRVESELFTQELIRDVRNVLRRGCIGLGFKIELYKETRGFKEVFKEFLPFEDKDDTHLDESKNANLAPMQQFRFNITLTMFEECGETVLSPPSGEATVTYSPDPTSGAASETLESGDTIIPVTVQKGLKDSGENDIIAETSVLKKLGESEDARQVAPDGLVEFRLKDTDGNTLVDSPVYVKSNGSEAETIIAPDSTINIQKQDSTPSDIGAVIPITAKSNETKSVNVPVSDATINIQRKDTGGNNIGAVIPVSVKAEATQAQDVESPDVIITDSDGNIVGFLDSLSTYTTTLLSGKTYTMSYSDRNVPTDGILIFDRLRIQSPELVLSADKAFTLSGTSVLGSEWLILIDNTAGHNVTFSSDFDVFGTIPSSRFTVYMVFHNASGKVLTYLDQSTAAVVPSSVIVLEDDYSVSPLAGNADRTILNPSTAFSISSSQLLVSTAAIIARGVNTITYPSFVSPGPMAVLSVNVVDATSIIKHYLSLYKDESNRIQLQDGGGVHRILVRVGGVNLYDYTTAISISTYGRIKTTFDHSTKEVKCFYWNSAWVQMGTTFVATSFPIDAFGSLSFESNTSAAHSFKFDNFTVCDTDYITEFPT
jgi:hypothetical protein